METPISNEPEHGEDHNPAADSSAAQPTCPGRRAALGCALAFGVASVLGERAEAATAKYYAAGTAKSYVLNKPKLVQFLGGQAAVFITKVSATAWQCLWAGCTHENCIVSWQANHAQFYCPCHGAKFSRTGKVTHGPANQAMFKLPLKVSKGRVMVDLAPTGLV